MSNASNRHPRTATKRMSFFKSQLAISFAHLRPNIAYPPQVRMTPHHWLAEIVVSECLDACRQADFEIQSHAAAVLDDL
jgi:hypothetical protein